MQVASSSLPPAAGSGNDTGAADGSAALSGADRLLLKLRGLPPSEPSRRLRQAVDLAQRLLVAERMGEHLRTRAAELELALASSLQETERARIDLSRAAKPTVYLVMVCFDRIEYFPICYLL